MYRGVKFDVERMKQKSKAGPFNDKVSAFQAVTNASQGRRRRGGGEGHSACNSPSFSRKSRDYPDFSPFWPLSGISEVRGGFLFLRASAEAHGRAPGMLSRAPRPSAKFVSRFDSDHRELNFGERTADGG